MCSRNKAHLGSVSSYEGKDSMARPPGQAVECSSQEPHCPAGKSQLENHNSICQVLILCTQCFAYVISLFNRLNKHEVGNVIAPMLQTTLPWHREVNTQLVSGRDLLLALATPFLPPLAHWAPVNWT